MDNSYRNVIPSTGNMTYTILGNTGSVIPSDHKIAQKNSFVLGLVWLRTCGIVLARTLPRKQLLTGLSVVPSPFFPFLSIFSSGFIAGPRLHFLSIVFCISVSFQVLRKQRHTENASIRVRNVRVKTLKNYWKLMFAVLPQNPPFCMEFMMAGWRCYGLSKVKEKEFLEFKIKYIFQSLRTLFSRCSKTYIVGFFVIWETVGVGIMKYFKSFICVNFFS